MTKIELVQKEMIQAMKDKNKARKEVLTVLLSALKAKAKDKRADLTEDEENAVIKRELKQAKETLDSAPADRTDIIEEAEFMISVLKEFAPEEMGEEQIQAIIDGVLKDLGLDAPKPQDKGLVMKNLMPLVKGKADGQLVNQLVSKALNN